MTDKILIDRCVVQQALEALFMYKPMVTGVTFQHGLDAMQALRAALEQQQVEQEPVAWLFQHEETGLTELVDVQQVEWGFEKNNPRWQKIGPVYTRPQPKREPLTDEEIRKIGNSLSEEHRFHSRMFARAIERAHGIGGDA